MRYTKHSNHHHDMMTERMKENFKNLQIIFDHVKSIQNNLNLSDDDDALGVILANIKDRVKTVYNNDYEMHRFLGLFANVNE